MVSPCSILPPDGPTQKSQKIHLLKLCLPREGQEPSEKGEREREREKELPRGKEPRKTSTQVKKVKDPNCR